MSTSYVSEEEIEKYYKDRTFDHIEKYYADEQNCFTDIREARRVFEYAYSTNAQWHAVYKALGIMYIHCPERIRYIVDATREELVRRAELLGKWPDLLLTEIPGE